jgi:hypothetical protein
MKKASAILLIIPILTGCGAHNLCKAYKPQPAVVNTPKAEMLMVEYPIENRPLGGESKVWGGMLILIPLVPYADTVMAPEYAMRGRFKYGYSLTKDIQDVIVKDIKASGMVKDVRVGDRRVKEVKTRVDLNIVVAPDIKWEGVPNAVPKGCWVLSLKLDEGAMKCTSTAYGLSIAATPLWLLGAPIIYGDFDLAITAQLKTDEGRVVAKRTFSHKVGYYQLLYNRDAGLQKMPKAYAGISAELRGFLKENL